MMRLHSRNVMAGLAICTVMSLVGCGAAKLPESVENNSLVIDQSGTVTSYRLGVFDKEYYDLGELEAMGREEVAAYNTAHQKGEDTPLVLEKVEEVSGSQGLVMVSYRYDSAETYQTYNERTLFYGTVEQAVSAGYDFAAVNQVLVDPKGQKSMVSSGLKDMIKKHVILLEEGTRVYCPYKVAYISGNAKALEDGSIDTTGVLTEEYPVIIVLDK